MTDSLRERLINALTWRTDTEVDVDSVLTIFAEHLALDATVDRVARAEFEANIKPEHRGTWDLDFVREPFLGTARAGLAALAAALAPEKEADRG